MRNEELRKLPRFLVWERRDVLPVRSHLYIRAWIFWQEEGFRDRLCCRDARFCVSIKRLKFQYDCSSGGSDCGASS